MKPNIYILSKAIQTGKTTELLQWCHTQNEVAGILTPDVNGSRKLYDIGLKQYFDFETKEALTTDDITAIGKFNFYTSVFEQAQHIMGNSTQSKYLVIDEIGRLELNEQRGLEPTLSKVIAQYVNRSVTGTLVLVIRDYLLDNCIEKYQLQEAQIIHSMKEVEQENNLIGLVLGGGKSSRMQTDKAFIKYHQKEQVYHLVDSIKPFCQQVFIACNETQKAHISKHYQYISDSATYQEAGPIAAILTAINLFPNNSFFVVACDYPLLTLADLFKLKSSFYNSQQSVSMYNDLTQFREPLLAIYHQNDLQKLLSFYKNGNTSLQYFLNEINAVKVKPTDLNSIKSIDTKVAFDETIQLIARN